MYYNNRPLLNKEGVWWRFFLDDVCQQADKQQTWRPPTYMSPSCRHAGVKSSMISAAKKLGFFKTAIQKFDARSRWRNFDQKNILFESRKAGRVYVFPKFLNLLRQISDEPWFFGYFFIKEKVARRRQIDKLYFLILQKVGRRRQKWIIVKLFQIKKLNSYGKKSK